MKKTNEIIERVSAVYRWIDEQIKANPESAGNCRMCGDCCDFASYDHRLFVTTPELIFFNKNLKDKKPMPTDKCPYNIENKCTVHQYRFAGCSIFCCKGNNNFQSRLTETSLEKLKKICIDFDLPYRYQDLATALNDPAGQ